jgi:hypothetical protein
MELSKDAKEMASIDIAYKYSSCPKTPLSESIHVIEKGFLDLSNTHVYIYLGNA